MTEQPTGYWPLVLAVCDELEIYEGGVAWLTTLGTVDRTSGLLYAAYFAQYEICNGGFWQLFHNDTGVLVPEAIEGFRMIGQPETAFVVEVTSGLFGRPYPRERDARQISMGNIGKASINCLNSRFHAILDNENGGFERAADAFVNLGGFAQPLYRP